MSLKESVKDFEFECYEKYSGTADEVKKQIEICPKCGIKLCFSHRPDCNSLIMEEMARCLNCDFGPRNVIHIIN
jgi:hypothetical protein